MQTRFLVTRFFYLNILPFKMFYYLYRKNRGSIPPPLPSGSTNLYFDGYPRSGNSFAFNLIKKVLVEKHFPGCEIVHHLHSAGALKIALQYSAVKIIPIRDPVDAISSSYLKYYALRNKPLPKRLNLVLLEHEIKQYVNFYRIVLENLSSVYVVEFKDFIKQPLHFARFVAEKIGIDSSKVSQMDVDTFEVYFKEKEKAKNPLGSSLPNNERNNRKRLVKSALENHKLLNEAKEVYKVIYQKRSIV